MKTKSKSGWWKKYLNTRKPQHQGLRYLIHLFNLDNLSILGNLPKGERRFERSATKKGHRHAQRPSGSKMLKRFNRPKWDLLYRTDKGS